MNGAFDEDRQVLYHAMVATTRPAGRDMAAPEDASRRRGYLRALAAEVPRIAAPILGKRGLGEAQLIAEWASIIGAELADHVSPDRLAFPRGERRDGVLHLRVASQVALEIQHREPQLIERINAFFGYRAIVRLRLVHAPPNPSARRAPPRPVPLAAREEQMLDQRLAGVEDPELRAALRRLGASVIGAAKRPGN
jgi:hypothetical protein